MDADTDACRSGDAGAVIDAFARQVMPSSTDVDAMLVACLRQNGIAVDTVSDAAKSEIQEAHPDIFNSCMVKALDR